MKKNFFGLSFLLFFRLLIYEFIAAIFWKSAGYVFKFALPFHHVFRFT